MIESGLTDRLEHYISDFYRDLSRVNLKKWNYEDGCILIAAIQLYQATGKGLFKSFVLAYLEQFIGSDGTVCSYAQSDYNLDHIAPGRALLFAYEQTGNPKYKAAADRLWEQLAGQPRTRAGNFWHKRIYPHQVWLDGLFMAQPFYMAYDTVFGRKNHYSDIVRQFANVRELMFDQKAQLYYHGYDETRSVFWADTATGCSPNFWLRAIAWYHMALVDTLHVMSQEVFEDYMQLASLYKEGIRGLLQYQDPESGLFYQLVDHKDTVGNYLETSGSAMIAASILKACNLRVLLREKYWKTGEEILSALLARKLAESDGRLMLKDTCQVAGLGPADNHRRDGSIAYYLSEPVKTDDNKGVAALFMAYAQYLLGRR